MDYKEWESLKTGNRLKKLFDGEGTIIASCGVGRMVKFDSGKVERISDGNLYKISKS